jgi:hypothetical protein
MRIFILISAIVFIITPLVVNVPPLFSGDEKLKIECVYCPLGEPAINIMILTDVDGQEYFIVTWRDGIAITKRR